MTSESVCCCHLFTCPERTALDLKSLDEIVATSAPLPVCCPFPWGCLRFVPLRLFTCYLQVTWATESDSMSGPSLSGDHVVQPVTETDKALTQQARAVTNHVQAFVGSRYLGRCLSYRFAARSLSQPCDSWEAQSDLRVYCRKVKHLP